MQLKTIAVALFTLLVAAAAVSAPSSLRRDARLST